MTGDKQHNTELHMETMSAKLGSHSPLLSFEPSVQQVQKSPKTHRRLENSAAVCKQVAFNCVSKVLKALIYHMPVTWAFPKPDKHH